MVLGYHRLFKTFLVLAWIIAGPGVASAEPTIRAVNIRGLQIGGTTTLILDGDEFGKTPRLLLPFPAQQKLDPKATDKQASFTVTLGGDVVPGYYQIRLVADGGGVSLPIVVAADRLPQRAFAPLIEQLPSALHGSASGSNVAETKFTGKAGQKVMVEVEAERLGGKLRPVVHLYSPKRLQVAWSWPTPALFGDARLEAVLPDDGAYTITLHDAEYAAPAPSFFRLRVGQWAFVDQVFPPVVSKGQPATVELLGSAGSAPLNVPPQPLAGTFPLTWPSGDLWSGPRPFVQLSANAELAEQPSAAKGQELPAGRIGVSGRLLTPYEEDRYRVPVAPGTRVRFEVFAERLGSPLDTGLVIRNEAGADLARAEDSPGGVDPVLEFSVPDKVTALVVAVVDAQGRGGPRGVYRLTVEPQTPGAQNDFRLFTTAQRFSLPVGGRAVAPVLVERRGFQGALELIAAEMPAGVKAEGLTIPEGAEGALVTLERGEAVGDAVVTRWRGRGANGVEQPVRIKGHPLERLQPWLATEIALAPTSLKAADFQIDWRDLPGTTGLVSAKKLNLPVKVKRLDEKTPVRLTLLTSQLPVLLNNQPDLPKTLRLEKPIELGAKATDAELPVLVPPELAAPVYDVAVQAELLSPDKQKVLAVAYTPVRRLAVRQQLVVKLDGPPRLDVALDAKKETMLKLAGQIERREGFTGDVVLTLTGLPPGVRADAITVKDATTAFAFNVVLPAATTRGEFKTVKLTAAAGALKSKAIDVTLVVK